MRLGANSMQHPCQIRVQSGGVARWCPICQTDLVKNGILHTLLTCKNLTFCRPSSNLFSSEFTSNSLERHSSHGFLFRSLQELIDNTWRELNTITSNKNLVVSSMSRSPNLWPYVDNEFFDKLLKAPSNLVNSW